MSNEARDIDINQKKLYFVFTMNFYQKLLCLIFKKFFVLQKYY